MKTIVNSDSYETPQWLFEAAEELFYPFLCDVAASEINHKCARFFTEREDGLAQQWASETWCNPPYSAPLLWVKKAISQAKFENKTVMLLPADLSTGWFKLCWDFCRQIRFLNHRVQFDGAPTSARFASMFVEFSKVPLEGNQPRYALIDLRHKINKGE